MEWIKNVAIFHFSLMLLFKSIIEKKIMSFELTPSKWHVIVLFLLPSKVSFHHESSHEIPKERKSIPNYQSISWIFFSIWWIFKVTKLFYFFRIWKLITVLFKTVLIKYSSKNISYKAKILIVSYLFYLWIWFRFLFLLWTYYFIHLWTYFF